MATSTAWLCYFPNCFIHHPCSISNNNNNKCMLSPSQHLTTHSRTHFHFLASQSNNTTTTRRSRRLKSDDEICSDIRQFLFDVGLPDDHIPSTKELLHHGRSDLANIVRRRGHKKIQDLLTSSLTGDIDCLNTGKRLDERVDAANDSEDLLTGENEKVDSSIDGFLASTEFLQEDSSGSMYADSTLSLDECTSIPVDSSASSSMEDDLVVLKDYVEEDNNVAERNFHPTEVSQVTTVDNDCGSSRGSYPNFGSQSSMPTEISGESSLKDTSMAKTVGDITFPLEVPSMESHSNTSFKDPDLDTEDKEFSHLKPSIDLSMEQKDLGALEHVHDYNNNITEDIHPTSEFSENKIDLAIHSADISDVNLDTSSNLSLEERVANFMQNGDLDPVEGDAHPPIENNAIAHNGNLPTSNQAVPSGKLDQPLWDDHMPHEDPINHFDKDLDAEAPNVQNQSEINHLKFMLYQKELELSRLKEQIEKEKHALSVLQTKAEEEISKVKKLISEKDAELLDAEESLTGLKEVVLEFCCDGDVVEVAGSFNGWHHTIKMEPKPLTSVIDHGGSRKSKFWSAMLWLYPGVYEIKFVVDGHWITDPQRESVARGHICNNILRVDR